MFEPSEPQKQYATNTNSRFSPPGEAIVLHRVDAVITNKQPTSSAVFPFCSREFGVTQAASLPSPTVVKSKFGNEIKQPRAEKQKKYLRAASADQKQAHKPETASAIDELPAVMAISLQDQNSCGYAPSRPHIQRSTSIQSDFEGAHWLGQNSGSNSSYPTYLHTLPVSTQVPRLFVAVDDNENKDTRERTEGTSARYFLV